MRLLLPLMLLIAGCAIGPYADTPVYKPPETKAAAARQLYEALATGAAGLSEVSADVLKLNWHERHKLSDKRTVWLERELKFAAIQAVARPTHTSELYELRVQGAGGQVTFEFKDGRQAAKAEAALRRLAAP